MADNPTPNPAPISREEFDALKDQMAEIALMLRETLKLKRVVTQDDPPKDDQGTSTENRFKLKQDLLPSDPQDDDRIPPKDNTNGMNMFGAGRARRDPNCKHMREIKEYPLKNGAKVLEGEYLEETKIIKQEVKMIRHQVKQLADLVVHQSELTRQLFTQLTGSQEKEVDKQESNWSPSQIIQPIEKEQSRLRGPGGRSDKVARRSHQWSFDSRSDECEPSQGKDQSTFARDRKFTPLSKSKAEMLHLLISRGKITKLLPPSDPKSKNYNLAQRCLYHSNSPGHDTEECWSLRHKIQNIIDGGEMTVNIDASIKESMTTDKNELTGLSQPGSIKA